MERKKRRDDFRARKSLVRSPEKEGKKKNVFSSQKKREHIAQYGVRLATRSKKGVVEDYHRGKEKTGKIPNPKNKQIGKTILDHPSPP